MSDYPVITGLSLYPKRDDRHERFVVRFDRVLSGKRFEITEEKLTRKNRFRSLTLTECLGGGRFINNSSTIHLTCLNDYNQVDDGGKVKSTDVFAMSNI